MLVNGQPTRTIWLDPDDPSKVCIIDQRHLPHDFKIIRLESLTDTANAISDMKVRGAPLIGATAAFGIYLALLSAGQENADHLLDEAVELLNKTRPTAVNLAWATRRCQTAIRTVKDPGAKIETALQTARDICREDIDICYRIGQHGLPILEALATRKPAGPLNILTHCNAGWLATVDWGTATAPIYQAHQKGMDIHVWVDETRPRNQGASLTAWELGQEGVPHTVITDNMGGLLMQQGKVDLVITGTDRTTSTGDVANKIGTYLKALAAFDNNIPFYVALPTTSIDWQLKEGSDIPIEERSAEEVKYIQGWHEDEGAIKKVLITPPDSPALNYGFDITPARLVTGFITEKGVCEASEGGLKDLGIGGFDLRIGGFDLRI